MNWEYLQDKLDQFQQEDNIRLHTLFHFRLSSKPSNYQHHNQDTLIWGFGFVFAKAAFEHFPPILLMAFRFEVTALALIWFVKPLWHLMKAIFLISFVSAALQYGFTFAGLKHLEASTALLVVQLEVPFMVILGALFGGEKPGLRRHAGIAVSFVGVAFIAGDPDFQGAHLWLFMVMLGAFLWAVGQVMVHQQYRLRGVG